MIAYKCPACLASLDADDNDAGTKKDCPKCGQRLQVPPAARNRTTLAPRESNGQRPPTPEPVAAAVQPRQAPSWLFLVVGILLGAGLMAGGFVLAHVLLTR